MKKVINLAKKFSPSIIALIVPAVAFAGVPPANSAPQTSYVPQAQIFSLTGVLQTLCTVFAWAFYFLVVFAVIMVIVAAFKYLTAAGDPEKVKSAGQTLLYAAVAIAVALLARSIPFIIGNFFGVAGGVTSC